METHDGKAVPASVTTSLVIVPVPLVTFAPVV